MMMTWKISRPGLCKNWELYIEHIINRRLFWSKRSLMFRKMAFWKKIERNKIKLWYNEIKLWFMYFMQYTTNPIWEEIALFF